ncbi:MAG: hypothetical protein ABEK29_02065, partial [Bradymonadaceae bacterium]
MNTTFLIAILGSATLVTGVVWWFVNRADGSDSQPSERETPREKSPAEDGDNTTDIPANPVRDSATKDSDDAQRETDQQGAIGQAEATEVVEDGGTETLDRSQIESLVQPGNEQQQAYFIVLSGARTGE